MSITKLLVALLALALTKPASAGPDAIKIGVLTDMSGPYSDNLGAGAVLAARIAVEEFGAKVLGKPIELVVADHQNKPDVGISIVGQWLDVDHVDTVTEIGNSSVALALHDILETRKKPALLVGAASTDLTGKFCSRYASQWNLDTYATANGGDPRVGGVRPEHLGFFITVDYTYGASVQAAAAKTIESLGGTVAGSVKVPLGETEFSQYLLRAQSSNAKVVGFIIAGTDLSQALKQANEFGLAKSQQLVPFLLFPSHIAALGLDVTRSLVIADSFYADHNEQTRSSPRPTWRAFRTRFRPAIRSRNTSRCVTIFWRSRRPGPTTAPPWPISYAPWTSIISARGPAFAPMGGCRGICICCRSNRPRKPKIRLTTSNTSTRYRRRPLIVRCRRRTALW